MHKNDDSSESDSEDSEDKITKQRFDVTMESAAHHCDVIKEVLREMLSEIGMVSEAEQNLCESVSETIKGSIDRIAFALDNLYEQGIDEHEKTVDFKNELKEQNERVTELISQLNMKGGLPTDGSFSKVNMSALSSQPSMAELEDLEENLVHEQEKREKAEKHSRTQQQELRRTRKDFQEKNDELQEQFEECQVELSKAKGQIAELQQLQINIEDTELEVEKLKETIEHARESKVKTIMFLDIEMTRLRELLQNRNETTTDRVQTT